MPTGCAHLVFRLDGSPQSLFTDARDPSAYRIGSAFVGGPRASSYDKAISEPVDTIGVLLRPGAVRALTGAPGRDLAGAHTPLGDIWKRARVAEIRERLQDSASVLERIGILEDMLARELPPVRGVHPLVCQALSGIESGAGVADIVNAVGCSHRHLAKVFEDAVGLTPKRYSRVRRLGRALSLSRAAPGSSWADIAADAGYADQAHLHREFRALAGLAPGEYRRRSSPSPWHVPV